MDIKVLYVIPVIDYKVRTYCTMPYPGHPKGCPMYNKRPECPPQAPRFQDCFSMIDPFRAVVCTFQLNEHAKRMLVKHPHWTKKQCRNPLYWQNSVRKVLRETCEQLCYPDEVYTLIPEAMGLDVVATMREEGIFLEFPPQAVVRKIAIIGRKLEYSNA